MRPTRDPSCPQTVTPRLNSLAEFLGHDRAAQVASRGLPVRLRRRRCRRPWSRLFFRLLEQGGFGFKSGDDAADLIVRYHAVDATIRTRVVPALDELGQPVFAASRRFSGNFFWC